MKSIRSLRRVSVALMLLVAFLFQGTWALAGTTGSLNGIVTDAKGAPVAGATVTATSPSQQATAVTDAGGRFSFLTLAPDTYSVAVVKKGYQGASDGGITVFADQNLSLTFVMHVQLKTIVKITSAGSSSLLKSGTVASVYSVNEATQQVLQGSGGGGNLQSAYSAIYQQPGIQSFIGNYGFGQVFYVRGGSYSQVGYEFDGIPVNRAFDNYNANSLSTLGAAQTQVYTGGSPASGTSATLGGYINQVIKTGTYPGTDTLTGILGGPAFYHSLSDEAGGSNPDRTFSYYIGLRGSNQGYRFLNSSSGNNYSYDGSNNLGITGPFNNFTQGAFGNIVPFGPANNYIGTIGPWATCGANGAAPAGSETYSPYVSSGPNAAGYLAGVLGAGPVSSCNSYGPVSSANGVGTGGSLILARDNLVNLHFAIPHKKNAGRDDVQLLYDVFAYHTLAFDNINQEGGLGYVNGLYSNFVNGGQAQGEYSGFGGGTLASDAPGGTGPYGNLCQAAYLNLFVNKAFNGGNVTNASCASSGASVVPWGDGVQLSPSYQFGSVLAAGANNISAPYLFPGSPTNRAALTGMPTNLPSGIWNNGAIVKLQYQKNINDHSYARIYGYSFYSDWLNNNPNAGSNSIFSGFLALGAGGPASTQYELNTHSRGLAFEYGNQLNDQNLLTFSANYVEASALRDNNRQAGTFNSFATILESGSGTCYSYTLNNNGRGRPIDATYPVTWAPGSPVSCLSSLAQGSLNNAQPGPVTGAALAAGANWTVGSANTNELLNAVRPVFTQFSLQDDFRPNAKLDLNLGVRFEDYTYKFNPPSNAETTFWFNKFKTDGCVDPATLAPAKNALGGYIYAPNCINPATGTPFLNSSGTPLITAGQTDYGISPTTSQVKTTFSPRIGGTYTFNRDTVLRFNYGRFVQPTETAFVTYLNNDGYQTANFTYTSNYFTDGFRQTVHPNQLQVSNNLDFSLEKHLKGTDITFKISPFYDSTQNQLVELVLGNLAGGINGASRKSTGIEIGIQKGDPSREGLSGFLGYSYTKDQVTYNPVNGVSPLTAARSYLTQFFNLTQGGGGAKCYAAGGTNTPDNTCAATSILNPYYGLNFGSNLNSFLDTLVPLNGKYPAYANFFPNAPGYIGLDNQTAFGPSTFTGWLSFKKKRLQASVNMALNQGTGYGNPFVFNGLDPRTCQANQITTGTGTTQACDYQTGQLAVGQTGATFSQGGIVVPNPTTGQFDSFGKYTNPWQLNLGAQVTYDVSTRVKATLTLSNLLNRCFGGSKGAWTSQYPSGSTVCGYTQNNQYLDYTPGSTAYNTNGVGFYNGATPSANNGGNFPAWMQAAYAPTVYGVPFQAYLQVDVKL